MFTKAKKLSAMWARYAEIRMEIQTLGTSRKSIRVIEKNAPRARQRDQAMQAGRET
jgi:hypothetical protein